MKGFFKVFNGATNRCNHPIHERNWHKMDQIYSIHHLVSLDAVNGYLKAIDAPEIDQNPINRAYYHYR
jgi:hypothetical protein